VDAHPAVEEAHCGVAEAHSLVMAVAQEGAQPCVAKLYIDHLLRDVAAHSGVGSSDFEKNFENCFASCNFELAKIYKTILEKAFFFILWCFYLFSAFVLTNFKIGPSES
jgi:hypothetical protein